MQNPTVANFDKADPPNLVPLVKGLGLSKEDTSVSIHLIPILVSVVATVGSYNAQCTPALTGSSCFDCS